MRENQYARKKTYIAVARKLVNAKKIFFRCAKISTNKV